LSGFNEEKILKIEDNNEDINTETIWKNLFEKKFKGVKKEKEKSWKRMYLENKKKLEKKLENASQKANKKNFELHTISENKQIKSSEKIQKSNKMIRNYYKTPSDVKAPSKKMKSDKIPKIIEKVPKSILDPNTQIRKAYIEPERDLIDFSKKKILKINEKGN
jgi:hypothetical protein